MDLQFQFYTLLALFVSQVSARNSRYTLPSASNRYTHGDSRLKNPEASLRDSSYRLGATKALERSIDDETVYSKVKESLGEKPDLTWWPSKLDFSESFNEINKIRSGYYDRQTKRPAGFEELENRNANIYNPLLNLDHHPIPSKKYTFEELENMNANQYNPYLN